MEAVQLLYMEPVAKGGNENRCEHDNIARYRVSSSDKNLGWKRDK